MCLEVSQVSDTITGFTSVSVCSFIRVKAAISTKGTSTELKGQHIYNSFLINKLLTVHVLSLVSSVKTLVVVVRKHSTTDGLLYDGLNWTEADNQYDSHSGTDISSTGEVCLKDI